MIVTYALGGEDFDVVVAPLGLPFPEDWAGALEVPDDVWGGGGGGGAAAVLWADGEVTEAEDVALWGVKSDVQVGRS